jgi:hypothetical protein
MRVQKLLGELKAVKGPDAWWHYGMPGHTERPQGVLLLLDRSEDLVSPALHFCTYQVVELDGALSPRFS